MLKGFKSVLLNNVRYSHSSKWIQPTGHDTGIKIYSCIEKRKVPLIIRNPESCTWYTCGPTVYGEFFLQ
jgi:hypothetical protein